MLPRLLPVALLLGAAGAMIACGGEEGPAPNVVGERLDRAQTAVQDAGLDYEVEEDTLFGVVVESNFTVCDQDPEPGDNTGAVTLTVDRSCPGVANAEEPVQEARFKCSSPEPAVCEVAERVFQDDALLAQSIGQPLEISYSFQSDGSRAEIEDRMTGAYEAAFAEFAGEFKYVDIAAFRPGDKPGIDFPILNTSIGATEIVEGEAPSSYWTVH